MHDTFIATGIGNTNKVNLLLVLLWRTHIVRGRLKASWKCCGWNLCSDCPELYDAAEAAMQKIPLDLSVICEFLALADHFGVLTQRLRGIAWMRSNRALLSGGCFCRRPPRLHLHNMAVRISPCRRGKFGNIAVHWRLVIVFFVVDLIHHICKTSPVAHGSVRKELHARPIYNSQKELLTLGQRLSSTSNPCASATPCTSSRHVPGT